MVAFHQKEGLKSALTVNGVLFATMDGMPVMLKLSAMNLATQGMVSKAHEQYKL